MMEKTDETIPSREELAVFIEEAAVSVTNNYEEAPAVLMVDDAVIGTLGNFSASIGKAKSKKTFNVSAIAASALSGRTVLRYRSMFPATRQRASSRSSVCGKHLNAKRSRVIRRGIFFVTVRPVPPAGGPAMHGWAASGGTRSRICRSAHSAGPSRCPGSTRSTVF